MYIYLSIYLIKGRFVHVALFVSKVMHKLSLEIEIDQEISKGDFGTFFCQLHHGHGYYHVKFFSPNKG